MPKYDLTIKRTEVWTRDVEVKAPSRLMAIRATQRKLDNGGWESVFPDNEDGDYDECYSEVKDDGAVTPTPVKEAKTIGELRSLLASIHTDCDDQTINPDWFDGPPGDDSPSVSFHGITMGKEGGLTVLVSVEPLEEPEHDDACDICGTSRIECNRATLEGELVCGSTECNEEADRRDKEYRRDLPEYEDEDE